MIRRCSRCSSISLSYASSRQNLAVHRRGSANTGRSFRPQLRVCKIINVLESFALAQLNSTPSEEQTFLRSIYVQSVCYRPFGHAVDLPICMLVAY